MATGAGSIFVKYSRRQDFTKFNHLDKIKYRRTIFVSTKVDSATFWTVLFNFCISFNRDVEWSKFNGPWLTPAIFWYINTWEWITNNSITTMNLTTIELIFVDTCPLVGLLKVSISFKVIEETFWTAAIMTLFSTNEWCIFT